MLPMLVPILLSVAATQATHTFAIANGSFLLDGKPTLLVAGEIHPARIPAPYWRHRIRMAKAMGLNVLSVYDFWNTHETEKGAFNFKGNADIASFIKLAQQEGMWVILRPGPYVCAEWEFGGYPYWLLTEPGCTVRDNNPAFMKYVNRYFNEMGKQVAPLQITQGGNILMVQVENEYGSYGSDKAFMGATRDALKSSGFDVPFYTADGPSQMPAGYLPGVLPGLNGGGGPDVMRVIDQFQKGGPYFVPEFYPGWLCHWGEKFPRSSAEGVAKSFQWYLKNNVSVSIYMWHGGTNFGYMNGANYGGTYQPHITSYDYDAPLSEAGHVTPKYMAMREVAAKYWGKKLPNPPAPPATIVLPRFNMDAYAGIADKLPKPVHAEQPLPMEKLSQGYGFVLYRHSVKQAVEGKLTIDAVRDYAVVMVNGKTVGTLDRRRKEKSLDVSLPAGAQLDILVENGGRINYGRELVDNLKGIVGSVTLDGTALTGWDHYRLPLNTPPVATAGTPTEVQPTFYHASVDIQKAGDTWLDLRGWTKGVVWVNGHNLGRFWFVGPQQTLYLPGCWLRAGKNDITVLELMPKSGHTLEGIDHPILDENNPEPPLRSARPALGFVPSIKSATPVLSGEFSESHEPMSFSLPTPATGRYVALELTSQYGGDDFASMAELWLTDATGKALGRDHWKVIYTSSEELLAEDGNADNLIDGDKESLWHTIWGEPHTKLPHFVVIDMGKTETLGGLRALARQASKSAIAKGFRLYISDRPFN